MKYKDWLYEWLITCVKPFTKGRTYEKYERIIRRNILPSLGEYDLENLSGMILQKYVAQLVELYAANTVGGIITVLQGSLKQAVKTGVVKSQHTDCIMRPKIQERKIECFTCDEQKKIEQYIVSYKPLNEIEYEFLANIAQKTNIAIIFINAEINSQFFIKLSDYPGIKRDVGNLCNYLSLHQQQIIEVKKPKDMQHLKRVFAYLVEVKKKDRTNFRTLTYKTVLARKSDEQLLSRDLFIQQADVSISYVTDNSYNAGSEIAVATTKVYNAQISVLYLLILEIAHLKNEISDIEMHNSIVELKKLSCKIQHILSNDEIYRRLVYENIHAEDIFVVGRNMDYATAIEGSLKIKETSYIHAESFASGELKHGPISLIEKGTLVIGIATQQEFYNKTINNIIEVKSRGANIILIISEGCEHMYNDIAITKNIIHIPNTSKYLMPILSIIPMQLLALHFGQTRGINVDKPRNLAKSVTVE